MNAKNHYTPVGHVALSGRKPQGAPQPTEAAKQSAKELRATIGTSHEVLFRATTVFPFTLFPDTVTVDRSKLTVTHRTFFKVGELISIRIEDILNVVAQVGPFFGSVKISTRFFDERTPARVNYMWRHDALRLERIIQGYIIALKKNIDVTPLSAKELSGLLDSLGQSKRNENI